MVRMIHAWVVPFLFSAVLFFFLYVLSAYAQVGGIDTSNSLRVSPMFPGPQAEVAVSLEVYSANTVGAAIAWYLDGVELAQFRNERNITLTTGDVGTSETVRAVLSPTVGSPITLSHTIAPTQVDIIIEADTSVPTFYKGRALPTSESPIRVIAIPHTADSRPASAYTYKWELDNKVLFGGPLLGKNAIETIMPRYSGSHLSVTVYDGAEKPIARQSIQLSAAEPEILFYADNPLRGLGRRAIEGRFALVEEEVTVRAEPYFLNANVTDPDNRFVWRINSQQVANPSDDPLSITLKKTGGGGNSQIELAIHNTKELLQYAIGSFNIFFE